MKAPKIRRRLAFVLITGLSAFSLLAAAQTKKPAPKPAAAAPAKKPPTAPAPRESDEAGAPAPTTLGGKEEREAAGKEARDGGKGGSVLEQKTLDGGSRVFRFGEVEVEGRLKSPQIVYFLRRVRAEFAAGDLGHRSFVPELSQTRNEPSF